MNEVKDAWDKLPAELKGDLSLQIFRDLSRATDHPRLLVIITHGFLELLVNALVETKCKHGKRVSKNHRDYPHSTKLVVLHELGVLTDDQFRTFDWFRDLRNKAAHEPVFTITKNRLSSLKNMEFHDPGRFYHLCLSLIAGFWNEHVDLFGPKFAPGVLGLSKKQEELEHKATSSEKA
jgi:hypothetical protein